jgi:hypothetical protein
MLHTKVKSYKYKVGRNHYIVLKIFQSSAAKADHGNVLASNAVNVKIFKNEKKRRKR